MIKIGITGGIGSGKSVVAELFRQLDVPVYNADQASKRIVNTSPVIREQLTLLFGNKIYTTQELNRKRLAELIFGNADNLHMVNFIIHSEVKRDFQQWTERQKKPLCAIESAILFESEFNQAVDQVLMVYAPIKMRIERVQRRDNTDRQEILNRIKSQLDDKWKRKHADHTILNDGKHALITQVWDYIKKMELQAQ